MKKLTVKEEGFCQSVLLLSDKSAAYRKHYKCDRMKDSTVHVKASELAKKPHVAARIDELQAEVKETFLVDVSDKKKLLWQIAERCAQAVPVFDLEGNETGVYKFDAKGAVSAVSELNRMDGDHAVIKMASLNKNLSPEEELTDDELDAEIAKFFDSASKA